MQAPAPATQQSFYYFPISAVELVLSDRASLMNIPAPCITVDIDIYHPTCLISNYWIGCAILSILSPLIPHPPISTFQSFYSDFNNFVLKRPGPTRYPTELSRSNEERILYMNDPTRSLHMNEYAAHLLVLD